MNFWDFVLFTYLVPSFFGAFIVSPLVTWITGETKKHLTTVKNVNIYDVLIVSLCMLIPVVNVFLILGCLHEIQKQHKKINKNNKFPQLMTLDKLKEINRVRDKHYKKNTSLRIVFCLSNQISTLYSIFKDRYQDEHFALILHRFDFALDTILLALRDNESLGKEVLMDIFNSAAPIFADMTEEMNLALVKEQIEKDNARKEIAKHYQEVFETERKIQKQYKFD